MMNYPLIGQRLFNVPLMLRPEKCEVVVAALLDHFGVAKLNRIDGTSLGVIELRQQAQEAQAAAEDGDRPRKAYQVIDGVGIIPIHGSLVQRGDWLDAMSGVTGYNQLDDKLEAAMDDRDVRSILLDADSPGGEVAGCFDLARKIANYSSRNGGKPIIAAVNEQACSAGYALISGADEIYMPETGVAGSIGVWTLLVDLTRALDKDGIEVTMIRAGDRKARGGPWERADKEIVTKLMNWVEATREQFARLVADHRRISFDDVMATQGDWYHGDETMTRGLVDGTGPFEAIFERARKLAN